MKNQKQAQAAKPGTGENQHTRARTGTPPNGNTNGDAAWLSMAETAAALNRTPRQVSRYVRAGKLTTAVRRTADGLMRIHFRRVEVFKLGKTVKPLSAWALYLRTLETSIRIAEKLAQTHTELLDMVAAGLVGETFRERIPTFRAGLAEVEADLSAVRATVQTELKPLLPKGRRGQGERTNARSENGQ